MNRREMVQQEMEEYRRRFGSSWRDNYFDNWIGKVTSKFPKGRCFLASPYSRPDEKNPGMSPSDYEYPPEERKSDLYMSQTMREFYATIDKVLEEERIDVKKLERKLVDENGSIIWGNLDEVFDMALPAFVKLREMGYTLRDLGE